MLKKQKGKKGMDNLASETKIEKKINSLFERTADEIFYDFFKKYGKWVLSGLTFLMLSVLYGTYQYNEDRKYEEMMSEQIVNILEKDNFNVNSLEIIEKERKMKEKHKAALLYLVEIDSKEALMKVYKETLKLKYVCQYPFTTYHFKKLVVTEELLYLKVLYFLGFYGYTKEMREFFLEKKMQSSVFAYYANYLVAVFTNDNNILKELFIGYDGYITNNRRELVYYTNLKQDKRSEKK